MQDGFFVFAAVGWNADGHDFFANDDIYFSFPGRFELLIKTGPHISEGFSSLSFGEGLGEIKQIHNSL